MRHFLHDLQCLRFPRDCGNLQLTLNAQISQRSRKSPVIVDEDCGIPTSVIDNYREEYDSGPLGPSDPRTLLLSMSDYKQPQSYDVYGTCNRLQQAFC